MQRATKKKLRLAAASTILASVLGVGGYEVYQSFEYERWKSVVQQGEAWMSGLTSGSDNPTLIWEYKPDSEFFDSQRRYRIRTNRYGFRERDLETKAKPTMVERIAVVGDSVALGFLSKDEDTFVRKMERFANETARARRVEVLNFGVDGYNPIQIAELVRTQVRDFEPDTVVYVMCMNDFDVEDGSGDKIRFFRKPGSFLFAKIDDLLESWSGEDYHEYHFERHKEEVYEKVVQMRDLLRQDGITFCVALVPAFYRLDASFENYVLTDMHKQIELGLQGEGIDTTDLLDAFKRTEQPPRSFGIDVWHLNKKGHSLVARELNVLLLDK